MASQLAYGLNRHSYTDTWINQINLINQSDQTPITPIIPMIYKVYSLADHVEEYYFWQDESQLIGKNGLFVMTNFYHISPNEWYNCEQIKLYKTVDLIRMGLVARQAYLYECINYRGRKNQH
jgi:hypothetical protein